MLRALTSPTSTIALVLTVGAAGIALAGDLPASRTDLTPEDLARVRAVTKPATDFAAPEPFEAMQAGAATSRKRVNRDAFSQSSANLTFEQERDFKLGNALFRKLWVSSPSSTQASDGLGPLFNARGCQSCHLKDGRGHPPEGNSNATSMFLRLARPAETDAEREALENHVALNFPDPVYGEQLQEFAVTGLRAEGKMRIDYEEIPVTLGDGEVVSLRKPAYSVEDLGYGPLDPKTTLSPRIAPQMIGMGLIQAIEPADIAANADPDDADGDGISGRVQLTREAPGADAVIGRFGWKAQNPSIRRQSATAFAGDIGISTPEMPFHHGDCTELETDCMAMRTRCSTSSHSIRKTSPCRRAVTTTIPGYCAARRFSIRSAAPPATIRNTSPAATPGSSSTPSS